MFSIIFSENADNILVENSCHQRCFERKLEIRGDSFAKNELTNYYKSWLLFVSLASHKLITLKSRRQSVRNPASFRQVISLYVGKTVHLLKSHRSLFSFFHVFVRYRKLFLMKIPNLPPPWLGGCNSNRSLAVSISKITI